MTDRRGFLRSLGLGAVAVGSGIALKDLKSADGGPAKPSPLVAIGESGPEMLFPLMGSTYAFEPAEARLFAGGFRTNASVVLLHPEWTSND